MKRALAGLALAALLVTSLSACWWGDDRRVVEEGIDQSTDAAFYTLPADLPAGAPGEIIRSKQVLSAPAGSRAWRVIYHSTDMTGKDIAVSGLVIVPDNGAPAGGRTVVAWAHPTTGSAAQCGPSVESDPFFAIEGMAELLLAGYAVTATDYQGMGVAGPSSYLLGVTEGNNVLDSVRAAQNLPGLDLSSNVLLWGHSQGGQAALFAAQQARDYAPELHLVAVGVAAPAADLNALITDDIAGISGVTISSLALASYQVAYGSQYSGLADILTPEGAAATPKMAALCLITQNKEIHDIAGPLVGRYVTSDPGSTEPWSTLLKENSAGGVPIDVPIFIGQGLSDTLVVPASNEGYASRLCTAGETVDFVEYKGVTHALAAFASLKDVMAFFDAALAGQVSSNCP